MLFILYYISNSMKLSWCSESVLCSEKEKVEGEELQEWLKLVVAPTELAIFISGKQESLISGKHESLLPLQTGSG